MESLIAKLYAVMDRGPLRALSLVMALVLAGMIFWDPTRFAAKTSDFDLARLCIDVGDLCRGDSRRRVPST